MNYLKLNILIIIEIIIITIISNLLINVTCNKDDFPCNYNETVDLTNSAKFPNGSYLYDGILIPQNLTAIYKTDLLNKDDPVQGIRGCICKVRTCINWCCNKNQLFDKLLDKCVDIKSDNNSYSINHDLKVHTNNGQNLTKNLLEYFHPLHYSRPCENLFPLQPHIRDYDEFNLLENGNLFMLDDNASLSVDMHCIALDFPKTTDLNIYTLTPYICSQSKYVVEPGTRDFFYMIGFIIAIPFMIITLIIYAVIPELRTLHGKSLIGYLSGLIIGYTGLTFIMYYQAALTEPFCTFIGFLMYYFFMSSFFWVNIISFDLWWNFTGRQSLNNLGHGKRFLLYCIYSYIVPLIFLIIIIPINFAENIPESLRIGIGDNQCFIKANDWSAMLYLYAPLLIIIVSNIVFFILTAKKIHNLKREMSRIMSENDNFRNFRSEQNSYGLFLKLFILMGIVWILEIISYLSGEENQYLFYVTDFCNMMQGVLIFVFFVLKKNVWRLIKKRYGKKSPTINSSFHSTKTTHVNLNHNSALTNLNNK